MIYNRVVTKRDGKVNGWLQEVEKKGDKTTAYLTAISPKGFKGYHLHRKRVANYLCIKGVVDVSTFRSNKKGWFMTVTRLKSGDVMRIPTNTPTGLKNVGKEEVWIMNIPIPAYDPKDKKEQVEYSWDELLNGVKK